MNRADSHSQNVRKEGISLQETEMGLIPLQETEMGQNPTFR